ncbi:MAG: site-2 protease family protein [Chitinophagaceae bacterium]
MENFQEPAPEMKEESQPVTEAPVVYPPKFEKQNDPANVWIRSAVSLAFYLLIGYYIFPSYKTLLLITAIVFIHEMGHFLAMKLFRYADLGIFFIPLLGAYVSGTKREVSQKESAIILLAGPMPGIIIGIFFYFLWKSDPYFGGIGGLSYQTISSWFIFLNLFNLLPVYPLDGGQLLNRVFLDEEGWLGKIFVFLSAAAMFWFAWRLYSYSHQPVYFIFFLFPLSIMLRMSGDSRLRSAEKKVESAGLNMDKSYSDLTDEEYWKTRDILIGNYPPFREMRSGPPYEYSEKEERIMVTIQSLLHRHLLQDVSLAGKLFIFLLWAAGIASPWLLDMDLELFRRLGL